MELSGERQDELLIGSVQTASPLPLVHDLLGLLVTGVSACQQEEEHDLGEGFLASGRLLGLAAELGDGVAPEGDAFVLVQVAAVIEQDWEAAHAEDGIVNFDLADDGVAVLLPEVRELWVRWEGYFPCAGGRFPSPGWP